MFTNATAFTDELAEFSTGQYAVKACFACRFANFAVLRSGGVPAVLFETGYISNAEDAKFLTSAEGRRAIAEAARRAIEVHLARVTTRR